MAAFRNPNQDRWQDDLVTFAIGVASGIAGGALVFRSNLDTDRIGSEIRDRTAGLRSRAGDLRSRADDAVRRLRPARLQRLAGDQDRLVQLEEDVLDAFRADPILSERPVDVGAISQGIIELSGWVTSADESIRAVGLANQVPGVRTVVNRMAVEQPYRKSALRRTLDEEQHGDTFSHTESGVGGMGRRRQSPDTDPDRDDDSQRMSQQALDEADRDQWSREGFAHTNSRMDSSPEVQAMNRTRYREEELDNQDPVRRRMSEIDLDD